MNTYKAFYEYKQIEVEASTSYEAKQKAQKIFQSSVSGRKKVKGWKISILILSDGKGNKITHNTNHF